MADKNTINQSQHNAKKVLCAAYEAFATWHQQDASVRINTLTTALEFFRQSNRQSKDTQPKETFDKMAKWQLDNASKHIVEKQLMPGPTGEVNELSLQGRGVFLIRLLVAPSPTALEGLLGQVITALVTGNTVIIFGETGEDIVRKLSPFLGKDVIQHMPDSHFETLLTANEVAGVASICTHQQAQQLQRKLASRTGSLCRLIAETDEKTLGEIVQPHYVFNFVTEKTVSNNITAIGGNAELLALESE
ncbi:1-pyrroline-5-carboxylate dehydrogenase [Marinomonas agarivorans]|nr:1-pyrroline-5-carboxylate dehydrogenase [Marinomonas agarivorans]